MARLNWVGIPGRPEPGVCLKTLCRSVYRARVMPRRCRRRWGQQEVAVGVLLLAEEGVNHHTGGIVHCDQQRERWHPAPHCGLLTVHASLYSCWPLHLLPFRNHRLYTTLPKSPISVAGGVFSVNYFGRALPHQRMLPKF